MMDLGRTVTTHYNLPSRDDECLSTWTTPCASTINCTRVVFYHEGLLVGSVPCLRSLSAVVALYPIDTTWQRASEHPYHLSARNLGYSFSLLCLIFDVSENISS